MTRVFVVDTTYLLELYSVPKSSETNFSRDLRDRMARETSARFHVPVGCLYKLCDHITDVRDGDSRRRLARQVANDVESSFERARPWVIAPAKDLPELVKSVRTFAEDTGRLTLNLTNSQTVDIAKALKAKYRGLGDYRVHIWTKNRFLKAYEPDPEPDPLV